MLPVSPTSHCARYIMLPVSPTCHCVGYITLPVSPTCHCRIYHIASVTYLSLQDISHCQCHLLVTAGYITLPVSPTCHCRIYHIASVTYLSLQDTSHCQCHLLVTAGYITLPVSPTCPAAQWGGPLSAPHTPWTSLGCTRGSSRTCQIWCSPWWQASPTSASGTETQSLLPRYHLYTLALLCAQSNFSRKWCVAHCELCQNYRDCYKNKGGKNDKLSGKLNLMKQNTSWLNTNKNIFMNDFRDASAGYIVQELCESRGGHPGLSVLTSLLGSMDVKLYWIMLWHWSQLVPNMSTNIWGH